MSSTVLLTIDPRGIATVMLNRPERHNAFNAELIDSLHETLVQLESDPSVRVLVLTGAGVSFSAGADLEHMQRMGRTSEADNFSDALAMARCLRKLDEFSKPVIARINGNAFGGGIGLIACADIAIGSSQARFSLSEVKFGLVAATIAPYVLAAIGQRQARRLLLTATRFDAGQALQLGLIHRHIDAQQLDQTIEQEIELLLQGGPLAQQASKKLVREIAMPATEQRDLLAARTARLLAQLRTSDEGREGLQAFLEKRKPDWSR
ncbi:MAG: enoyl-CoA hydratase-related protein [Steroidobacteraceae bacterium]